MISKSVLFLDADGVLNRFSTKERGPGGFLGIEREKAKLVQRILQKTNAFLVISSSWRKHPESLKYLLRELGTEAAIRYMGKTPVLDEKRESGLYTGKTRGAEIQAWLDKHPEVTNFVILDDDDDGMRAGPLKERHIKTNMAHGLTDTQAEEVIRMLNER